MPSRSVASISSAPSVCALFQDTVSRHPDRLALEDATGSTQLTWRAYDRHVRRLAAGLHALGVRRGDAVGLFMSNRWEFHALDAAAMHLGAVAFSLYPTSPSNQVAYILRNAGASLVFAQADFVDRVRDASADLDLEIVCIDGGVSGCRTLADLAALDASGFDFDAAWRRVEPDDLLTLIYTSGTTGAPKGVEITHRGMLSNLATLPAVVDADETDRVVSYLPDAHIVNRWVAQYGPAVWGVSVTDVADTRDLAEAIKRARPTLFVAVPSLWYKMNAGLEARIAAETGPRGALAAWAVRTGKAYAARTTDASSPSLLQRATHAVAESLVLRRIRSQIGLDRVRLAVSGAAPVAPEALTLMLALGLPICEAWGMSELSAVVTMNRPGRARIGSVGQGLPGIELRRAPDGELFVRSPGLMRGYRGDPARTAEVVDDEGWLQTGDIGEIDDEGYVRIVDRKKEIIITSGGKNISPSNIENQIRVVAPLVGSVIAIGDRRPYVVALIALDAAASADFAAAHGLDPDIGRLCTEPAVRAAVEASVDAANDRLSRVEQVKRFTIVPTHWEPGNDELTPKLSLRRAVIHEKYAEVIDALYAGPAAADRARASEPQRIERH